MDAPTLRLSDDDLRQAVEDVDGVQALAEALVARSTGRSDWAPTPGALSVRPDGRTVEYSAAAGTPRCSMSTAGLRGFRQAVFTALATRHLLTPGVVTASVVGTPGDELALDLHLAVLRRHVPDVSHIAVAVPGAVPAPGVAERLERDGIALSLVPSAAEAVFGANLVVLTGRARLEAPRLAKGAVLVNATGSELPQVLMNRVRQVYVDDPARAAAGPAAPRGRARARHGRYQRRPAVVADLGQVLAGEHPGRTDHDHVLLVELREAAHELEATVAGHILRTAVSAGLGEPVHR